MKLLEKIKNMFYVPSGTVNEDTTCVNVVPEGTPQSVPMVVKPYINIFTTKNIRGQEKLDYDCDRPDVVFKNFDDAIKWAHKQMPKGYSLDKFFYNTDDETYELDDLGEFRIEDCTSVEITFISTQPVISRSPNSPGQKIGNKTTIIEVNLILQSFDREVVK